MPYIRQEDRDELEPSIQRFWNSMHWFCDARQGATGAGVLNYVLTRILLAYVGPELSYEKIMTVTGVLENVKQEFYRRVAEDYEESKKEENGDVY